MLLFSPHLRCGGPGMDFQQLLGRVSCRVSWPRPPQRIPGVPQKDPAKNPAEYARTSTVSTVSTVLTAGKGNMHHAPMTFMDLLAFLVSAARHWCFATTFMPTWNAYAWVPPTNPTPPLWRVARLGLKFETLTRTTVLFDMCMSRWNVTSMFEACPHRKVLQEG